MLGCFKNEEFESILKGKGFIGLDREGVLAYEVKSKELLENLKNKFGKEVLRAGKYDLNYEGRMSLETDFENGFFLVYMDDKGKTCEVAYPEDEIVNYILENI